MTANRPLTVLFLLFVAVVAAWLLAGPVLYVVVVWRARGPRHP